MSSRDELSKPIKTWSHLASGRRRPSEYEIVSARMLWNTPNHTLPWRMGSATPTIQWIIKNRNHSRLQHHDWNAFSDPDRLVYRTYNLMQDGQERYVDGLLDHHNNNRHDLGLAPAWIDMLAALYTPARYAIHAVQMVSGYLVALAPSSTIANCFMFQAGDQLRWVSRIAYRTAELAISHPDIGFGTGDRYRWEKNEAWRGFLELAERCLVAWDWGESFVALNLVLKPALDEAFMHQLGRVGRQRGDVLLGMLLDAQFTDSERSRRFTGALVRLLVEGSTENRQVIAEWIGKWAPLGDRAIDSFCGALDDGGAVRALAKSEAARFRASLGFT